MSLPQQEYESLILDLESFDELSRKQGIFRAAKALDPRLVDPLKHIAAEDPSNECRFLARKALSIFAAKAAPGAARARPARTGKTQLLAASAEGTAEALSSPDRDLRGSALRAAAMNGDLRLTHLVMQRVRLEPDPDIRSLIPGVLKTLAGAKSIPALGTLLDDTDPRVRANSIEALEGIRDAKSYALIVKALQDSDHRIVSSAIKALAVLGKINLITICSRMMEQGEYWMRDSAVYCLSKAQAPEAVPLLEMALSDEYESVQHKAMDGLQSLADAGVASAKEIVAKLKNEKRKKLSATGEFRALEVLAFQDQESGQDVQSRRRKTGLLASMGIANLAIQPVLDQLKGEDDETAIVNLLRALGKSKQTSVVPVLKEYLQKESAQIRAAAVDALALIGGEALDVLTPCLDDPDPQVIGKVILAIRATKSAETAAKLEALVSSPDASHRRTATFVLSELAEQKFSHLLEKLSKDGDKATADMAIDALRMMTTPSAAAPSLDQLLAFPDHESRVRELIERMKSPLASDRDEAVIALGDFLHQRTVQDVLRDASESDPDTDVRFHARQIFCKASSYFTSPPHPDLAAFLRSYQSSKKADIASLHALLANKEPAVRLQAIGATLQMEDRSVADVLLPYLDSETDPWVLAGLISILGKFGSSEHLTLISKFFTHGSPRVVANAISAAYSLSPDETFPLVVPLLSHRDHRVLGNVLVILAQRDPNRFVGHLRLMAGSRKEALRASALHCMGQASSLQVEEILLDMYMSETSPDLVTKQSDLLSRIGGEESVNTLDRLAGKRPEREAQIRLIVEKIGTRLGWADEVLQRRLLAIGRSRISSGDEAQSPQPTRSKAIQAITDAPVHPSMKRWIIPGSVVMLALLALIFRPAAEQDDTSGSRIAAASATSSTRPTRRSAAPPPATGSVQTITGKTTYVGDQNVILKSGYQYFIFDFQDRSLLKTCQRDQVLCIKGRTVGWDEDAGGMRMTGETVTPVGGKNAL